MLWAAFPILRRYRARRIDRKSTRLNSSHSQISYAVFCLKKKKMSHCHLHIFSEVHLIVSCSCFYKPVSVRYYLFTTVLTDCYAARATPPSTTLSADVEHV